MSQQESSCSFNGILQDFIERVRLSQGRPAFGDSATRSPRLHLDPNVGSKNRVTPQYVHILPGRGSGVDGMRRLDLNSAESRVMASEKLSSPRRRLSLFTGHGYDKGRGFIMRAAWVVLGQPVTRSVLCPATARAWILRAFGANIGEGARIRHNVTIHWPWKLSVGRDSWIGAGVWLLNLEPIYIGSDVCVSQWALLCTGSHHWDDPAFEFDNAPIVVEDGTWIAARSTVLRGVTIGAGALIGAGAVITRDVPACAKVYPTPSVVRLPDGSS